MDTLEGITWSVLPNWGNEGWDAGAWPYIIFAVARARDRNGELFGYGTYVEGDTSTHWFRSQDACFEAITADVFFHWASGQSDGPDNLPATAAALPGAGPQALPRLDGLKLLGVSLPLPAGTPRAHCQYPLTTSLRFLRVVLVRSGPSSPSFVGGLRPAQSAPALLRR